MAQWEAEAAWFLAGQLMLHQMVGSWSLGPRSGNPGHPGLHVLQRATARAGFRGALGRPGAAVGSCLRMGLGSSVFLRWEEQVKMNALMTNKWENKDWGSLLGEETVVDCWWWGGKVTPSLPTWITTTSRTTPSVSAEWLGDTIGNPLSCSDPFLGGQNCRQSN